MILRHKFIFLGILLLCTDNSLSAPTNSQYVKLGDVPYVVSLESNGQHVCGGSILSNEWILTAAECVENLNENDVTVVAGIVDSNQTGQRSAVRAKVLHSSNNVVLLQLRNPFNFDQNVQPVGLKSVETPFNSQLATTTWTTNPPETLAASSRLQKIYLTTVDKAKCSETAPPNNGYCVQNAHNNDICNNEAGWPIVDLALRAQVGISSKVSACKDYQPQTYTNVMEYLDWILKSTNENARLIPAVESKILNQNLGVNINYNESNVIIRQEHEVQKQKKKKKKKKKVTTVAPTGGDVVKEGGVPTSTPANVPVRTTTKRTKKATTPLSTTALPVTIPVREGPLPTSAPPITPSGTKKMKKTTTPQPTTVLPITIPTTSSTTISPAIEGGDLKDEQDGNAAGDELDTDETDENCPKDGDGDVVAETDTVAENCENKDTVAETDTAAENCENKDTVAETDTAAENCENKDTVAETDTAAENCENKDTVAETDTAAETTMDPSDELGEQTTMDPLDELRVQTTMDPSDELGEQTTMDPLDELREQTTIDVSEELREQTTIDVSEELREQTTIDVSEELREQTTIDVSEELREETTMDPSDELSEQTTMNPLDELRDDLEAMVTSETTIGPTIQNF